MANHIQNDRGEWVVAVGAPASIARAKVQYPALIEEIDELYAQGGDYQEAERLARSRGAESGYEVQAIIHNTIFGESK